MLVNPSGLEGHAMPMDLNIKHLIGNLKVCEDQSQYLSEPDVMYFRNYSQQKGYMQTGISWATFLPVSTICSRSRSRFASL